MMIPARIHTVIQELIAAGLEGGLDADDECYRLITAWLEMPYAHRNGETVPPSVPGWYWFDGHYMFDGPSNHIREMAVIDVEIDALYMRAGNHADWLRRYQGRWWGPIPQPWKGAQD